MILAAAIVAAATLTRARYAMGTVCEITAPPAAIEQTFAEADRIESFLSTWRDDTELSRLNRSDAATVSPELYDLLRTVLDLSHETNGAFNPLVRPLIDAWKIRESGSVPDPGAIREALARVQLGNVALKDGVVTLHNGARFEEGGFGKGYALDRMMAKSDAVDLVINFGGQVAVRGKHVVSIADPRDRSRAAIALEIESASISTSSGSEKSFIVGGRRFSHIVDPRTGDALPPRGSVSVIDRSALRADVLSTALYVMGPEAGLAWARAHGVRAIFISESGEIKESR